jgi:hypothetical protein
MAAGNNEVETLYVVSVGYNGDQIETHCWGDGCGQGDVGMSITICGGEFLPCRCVKEECPIFDVEKPLQDGELPSRDGPKMFHFVVRRLKKGALSREATSPRTSSRARPGRS